MKTRTNARLLILNPANEILLMKIKDKRLTNPDGTRPAPFWGTFGGGVDDGETLLEAAAREAREETGGDHVRIGPPVWYGEVMLTITGEPVLLRETYFVAWLDNPTLSRARWEPSEHEMIQETRWWSVDALRGSTETIYPLGLAELLPPIIAGDYPLPLTVLR